MSSTDRIEFRLLDTDLVTQKCILPVQEGRLYFEFQEPGSGDISIPLDSAAAALVSSGMFVMAYYRGTARGGFFVENIKKTPASTGEGGDRMMSISGRGAMALLDDCIVYPTDSATTESTRTFSAQSKGAILNTLINEGFARGWGDAFDWDFNGTDDSNSVAWTDSEDIELNIGQSLLDVVRDFASTGEIEFSMEYVLFLGNYYWRLHAYSTSIGTDLSNSIFMRIGYNCVEVSEDERGNDIRNAYLVKFRDGYTNSVDSASITARRRREKILNLDVAQSGDSALTFASAKLSQTKDPLTSLSVRVTDEVSPRLFVDYDMGDTITVDRFGSEISYRVLGIQANFKGDEYADVILELNSIWYDDDMRMNRDLDRLLKQWNTAKDANQQEIKKWLSIGQPNGEVYSLHYYDGYLYVGGDFTQINGVGLSASYIARYNTATGIWSAMGATITQIVRGIINVGSTIYVITTDKIYSWGGSSWTLVGTGTTTTLKAIATDGTNLFVGGTLITSIDTVACAANVMKYSGSWTDVSGVGDTRRECHTLQWWNGKLYAGFLATVVRDSFQVFNAAWDTIWTSATVSNRCVSAFTIANDDLIMFEQFQKEVLASNNLSATPVVLGTISNFASENNQDREALAAYLSDVYIGMQFTTIGSITDYNNIARYSGGNFLKLGTGFSTATPAGRNDKIQALAVVDSDVYAGGLFTTAGGQAITNLAVWVTSFDSLVSHLQNGAGFDMAAAIHNATASAITDNDEMGFWEDVSNALRKITWANIKATLKTYFDTLYKPISASSGSVSVSDFMDMY